MPFSVLTVGSALKWKLCSKHKIAAKQLYGCWPWSLTIDPSYKICYHMHMCIMYSWLANATELCITHAHHVTISPTQKNVFPHFVTNAQFIFTYFMESGYYQCCLHRIWKYKFKINKFHLLFLWSTAPLKISKQIRSFSFIEIHGLINLSKQSMLFDTCTTLLTKFLQF